MKVSSKQLLLVILVSISQLLNAEPDFKKALKDVENDAKQEGNINYDSFCATTAEGNFKLGCQIKSVPNVRLLVCLIPEDCKIQLSFELDAMKQIRSAGLKVVRFNENLLGGLKCGLRRSKFENCFGFLEEWIPAAHGVDKAIATHIFKKAVANLLDEVKTYQQRSGWKTTAQDLESITKFMKPPDGRGKASKQICDLQGFFMKTGGFLISHPAGVLENVSLNDKCYNPLTDPTTQQVLDGLNKLASDLKK